MGFKGFLTPLEMIVSTAYEYLGRKSGHAQGLNVPTAKVKLDDRDEPLCWIIHHRHWQQCLGVLHEATFPSKILIVSSTRKSSHGRNQPKMLAETYLVILSSMLFGSRMKVGRVMRLRSAPGLSCEIIDSNTIASSPISPFAPKQGRGKTHYSSLHHRQWSPPPP